MKHQPVLFSVGSQVLLENTAQKNRKGGKLEPAWLGPYTVNKYVGKGLYELSRKGSVLKKKASIVRLKLYKKRIRDATNDKDVSISVSPKKLKKVCTVEKPAVHSITKTGSTYAAAFHSRIYYHKHPLLKFGYI